MSEQKKMEGQAVQIISSFSTSDMEDQLLISSEFYQEFIKQNCFLTAKISNTFVIDSEHGKPIKPYAVYSISVKTLQIQYNIEKRYSHFLRLYKKLQKKMQIKAEFPAKTYIFSSTEEKIMEHRKISLNKFIQEIQNIQAKSTLIQFFEFLNIRNTYINQKIQMKSFTELFKKNDEQIVSDLIERFSSKPEDLQQILNELENCIFDRRIKISSELIRMMLIGLGRRKGILVYCLESAQHDFICLKGLQFINKLLSFQFNRDAEAYIKVFITCKMNSYNLNSKFAQFSQIKLNYFKLLEIYFKRCESVDDQALSNCNQALFEEYAAWSNSRQKNIVNVQLFRDETIDQNNRIHKKAISQGFSILKQDLSIHPDKMDWKLIKQYKDENFSLKLENFGNNYMKFTLQSVKSISKLQSLFLHPNKWNMNISSCHINQYKKNIEYTMKLGESRLFKFLYEIDRTNSIIIKKYPSDNSSQDSYMEIIKLQAQNQGFHLNKVIILSKFITQRSKQYFKSELTGKTCYLFDSIKKTHSTI